MDIGRAQVALIAVLAGLGGLVLGAAAMLFAFEAREDPEDALLERVETAFAGFAPEGAFEIHLDEVPSAIERSGLPLPEGASFLGGFEGGGGSNTTATARFQSDAAPRDVIASLRAETPEGWQERVFGERDLEPSVAFCTDETSDVETYALYSAVVPEGQSATVTTLTVMQGAAALFCDDEPSFTSDATDVQPQEIGPSPFLIAEFNGTRPPGVGVASRGSGGMDLTGGIITTTSSLTFGAAQRADEVLAHYLAELARREPAIEFSEPVASARIAIVGVRGSDSLVSEYEGALVVTSDEDAAVTVTLSLAYENTFGQPFDR